EDGIRDYKVTGVQTCALPISFDSAIDGFPVWSRDGSQIAFESTRNGSFDIYIKAANGTGHDEALLEAPGDQWPSDFSPDGKYLRSEERRVGKEGRSGRRAEQ